MAASFLLQHLLAASARAHPNRVAVTSSSETLTYDELDERSSRLATMLWRRGVNFGDRVGLYMPKSASAIVAMYAILKVGAAYVPLDPGAPARRIGYILRDCGVRAVISGPAAAYPERTEAILGSDTLDLHVVADAEASEAPTGLRARDVVGWRDALSTPAEPLIVSTMDVDLAYILYTSGSTGEPKGVMISHRNALTFVDWCTQTFGVVPEDRLSNHAPFHFDLSIFDIFAAASAGASVHLVPEGLSIFPVRLAEWIERMGITVWYSVPSILTLLALHGKLGDRDLATLRLVLFAGEVFPLKHLQSLVASLPRPRFFNLYGPTETNVCTYYEVDRAFLNERTTPIPIGRACENMGVFALMEDGNVARQPGEVGKLLVRGSGVALG
jgi:amino acid adenylation domain-containing protein